MSWRFVAYEKFVFGSIFPAMSIGPCIVKPPCRPTIVWPPISMVGAPSAPRTPPRFAMKNASLPRPNLWPRLKYPRSRSNSVAFGSYSNSTKKLKFGVIARETKSSTSSGGSNFTSVSRGDSLYSNRPPETRRARLSITVLRVPSSFRLPTRPSGRDALGIWKPIMWNCSPNRLRRGGRVWQALHCMSYWRANAGIASTDRASTYANSIPARTVAKNARRNMPFPFRWKTRRHAEPRDAAADSEAEGQLRSGERRAAERAAETRRAADPRPA